MTLAMLVFSASADELAATRSSPPAVTSQMSFELPCETRGFACDQQALFVLDQCGTIMRLDPGSDEQKMVGRHSDIGSTLDIAVTDSHFAVLANGRREIHLFARDGKLVTSFKHEGAARAIDIALWNDTIAVAQFYDEHLIHLYSFDGTLKQLLISNPRYREGYAPRFPTFASLKATPNALYLFDQYDFKLYVIERSGNITTIEKEQHPYLASYRWPEQRAVPEDDRNTSYHGTFFAMSIDVAGDTFMALMVARDGSGGTEIAYGPVLSEQWAGELGLAGSAASAGTAICSLGDSVFILDRKAGHVLSAKLR
jgi:hypothetical protein